MALNPYTSTKANFSEYLFLVHAYRDICALIPWNKNRISMAENDISPLKMIFHGSTIVFHWLMNGLLKISRYLRHYLSSAYRISNIPAPFLSLLLWWAARPDPDKNTGGLNKVRGERERDQTVMGENNLRLEWKETEISILYIDVFHVLNLLLHGFLVTYDIYSLGITFHSLIWSQSLPRSFVKSGCLVNKNRMYAEPV